MTPEQCACGRAKLPDSGGLHHGPVRADIMQRLETIRKSRIAVASSHPLDHAALDQLSVEEADLRARLSRITHES